MNKNASVLTCDMRGMYYLLLVGAVLRSLVYRVARQAGAVAIPLIVDRLTQPTPRPDSVDHPCPYSAGNLHLP